MRDFNIAYTYQWDLPLFEELGFEPFTIADQQTHYVGKYDFEDGSYVRIFVTCMPAQFWTANIVCKETDKITDVKTGSGSLSDYWPMFKQIATGMAVIS